MTPAPAPAPATWSLQRLGLPLSRWGSTSCTSGKKLSIERLFSSLKGLAAHARCIFQTSFRKSALAMSRPRKSFETANGQNTWKYLCSANRVGSVGPILMWAYIHRCCFANPLFHLPMIIAYSVLAYLTIYRTGMIHYIFIYLYTVYRI